MSSRLRVILIALAASGLIGAGCSGGDDQVQTPTPTTSLAETAATSGGTFPTSGSAYEECLQAAQNVPDEVARKHFEQRCEQIPR